MLNAVYSGPWVSDAKRYFSKTGGPAYGLGSDYVKGNPIRQHYLEAVIKWISGDEIKDYMGLHQHDASAEPLWEYFKTVIAWVKSCFKTYPKLMPGVDWGSLYNRYHDTPVNRDAIEQEIQRLIDDEDVTKQQGIFEYIFTRDERHLNIRAFQPAMKLRVYERQGRKCVECGGEFPLSKMEADHIKPWIEGGKTNEENCQILCKACNRRKSSK